MTRARVPKPSRETILTAPRLRVPRLRSTKRTGLIIDVERVGVIRHPAMAYVQTTNAEVYIVSFEGGIYDWIKANAKIVPANTPLELGITPAGKQYATFALTSRTV